MVDASNPDDAPVAAVCTWCSAPLSAADTDICPSCGAALRVEGEQQLPGLTSIDAEAILRAKNAPKQRSRLLSWLSGDVDDTDVYRPGDSKAVAFPDLDVRREMLKLEIQADLANLQAEADAMISEAAAEGRVLKIPPDLAEAAGLTPLATAGAGDEGGEGDRAGLEAEADASVDAEAAALPEADEPA
jgi:hypothetical protein